jgi:hypothetical protein
MRSPLVGLLSLPLILAQSYDSTTYLETISQPSCIKWADFSTSYVPSPLTAK